MTTLIILHGWGSSSQKWQGVQEILSNQEGIRVIVPDLPGFGENPPPQNPWSVNDYLEWVRSFCEKENLSQFFLLGHSFGGRIAIKFAVKYPERISGLILCGAPAIKDKLNIKLLSARALAKFSSKFSFIPFYNFFRKSFYKYFLRKTDYIQLEGGIMKETFKKVIAEDLASYLPQIKSKTLILWGEKDDFVSVKLASLIKDRISNSKLIIFPKVGHSPHLEIPDKFSGVILKFLNE